MHQIASTCFLNPVTDHLFKTTSQFHSYVMFLKFSKILSMIKLYHLLHLLFHISSLAFYMANPRSSSFYYFLIIYIIQFLMAVNMMLSMSTFAKHLIVYHIIIYYVSFGHLVSQGNFGSGLVAI